MKVNYHEYWSLTLTPLGEDGSFLDSTNEECRKRLCLALYQILDRDAYLIFHDKSLVQNYIYTYGTTREQNTAIASDVA